MRRFKLTRLRLLLCAALLLFTYYYIGIGDYVSTRNFEKDFDYPLNGDILSLIKEVESGKEPTHKPINLYPYRFLSNSGKCKTMDRLDLLISVKSAMENYDYRMAARKTWGQENALSGKMIKVLFFIGMNGSLKSETQTKINEEMARYNDIIQADFYDSYFNNTIKTMMTFRWIYQHCPISDYYLFSDDDYYISVRNLLDFTESRSCAGDDVSPSEKEDELFAGYVFNSSPHRIRSSKWRVSLEEYPWNRWPAYVTAGAYVISNKSMKKMYLGSLFVKHFRFDDVFLGIVAKKVGIKPYHCSEFYYYKKPYTKEGYEKVIASHGFDDHEELARVWSEQNIHE